MRTLKAIHRWASIVFGIFLLLLAGSGVWIQFEPNRLDEVLPGRMDDATVLQKFTENLQTFHALRPGAAISGFGMNISGEQPFVAFNVIPTNGVQASPGAPPESVMLGLRTGELLPPESVLHGALLQFHNSLFIGTTGRVICIGAGLTLLYLACSGLYFYLDLLLRRVRRSRASPFWKTPTPPRSPEGGRDLPSAFPTLMRDVHRWVTTIVAVFLVVIASTGLLMQTGPTGLRLWSEGQNGPMPGPPQGGGSGFTDQQMITLLKQSIANARQTDPQPAKLFMIDLNGGGDDARLALTYSSYEEGMYSRLYKAQSGLEYPQPKSLFFFLLRLHRGDLFHDVGVWTNIVCGGALILLGISGLVIYLTMLRRRTLSGRRGLFWS